MFKISLISRYQSLILLDIFKNSKQMCLLFRLSLEYHSKAAFVKGVIPLEIVFILLSRILFVCFSLIPFSSHFNIWFCLHDHIENNLFNVHVYLLSGCLWGIKLNTPASFLEYFALSKPLSKCSSKYLGHSALYVLFAAPMNKHWRFLHLNVAERWRIK